LQLEPSYYISRLSSCAPGIAKHIFSLQARYSPESGADPARRTTNFYSRKSLKMISSRSPLFTFNGLVKRTLILRPGLVASIVFAGKKSMTFKRPCTDILYVYYAFPMQNVKQLNKTEKSFSNLATIQELY
jgi:hypothetical protein